MKTEMTMIDPLSLGFDIDGVVADTMALFIDIVKSDYHIQGLRYEDITSYCLEECLALEPRIIEGAVAKILCEPHALRLRPVDGALGVLKRLSDYRRPLVFVTARQESTVIDRWLQTVLPLPAGATEIVATGAFDAKVEALQARGINYFVEDRLETCYPLHDGGIVPVLFKQPWNRRKHPFIEVEDWQALESLIAFDQTARVARG